MVQRPSESQSLLGAAWCDGCSHSHNDNSSRTPARAISDSSFSWLIIESDTKSSSSASTSGEDTSLYSKEVAHSRYRGNDAVLLRHRTHALHRAHLRPLGVHMLLEPLLVTRAKAVNRSDFGLDEQRAEHANPRHRG